MLQTETIIRVWQCDGVDCPTAPTESIENPYFRVSVWLLSNSLAPCEIDLCPICIQTITAQPVVDYVSSLS